QAGMCGQVPAWLHVARGIPCITCSEPIHTLEGNGRLGSGFRHPWVYLCHSLFESSEGVGVWKMKEEEGRGDVRMLLVSTDWPVLS
ncbi:hypothetical protein BJV74DRAFT_831668, partial [Russula compacta]